jgi:putative ABC transport system permease protein
MVTLIAWRNVWRSRLRSLVVIIAVALGLMAGVFMIAFSYGVNQERASNIIETRISHIQLHEKNFKDEMKVSLTIPDGEQVLARVEADARVKAATSRLVLTGMIQTSRGAYGVQIIGIDPEKEATVTQLKDRVIQGKYLDEDSRNGMLIGGALMEKLGWTKKDSSGITYTLRRKKPTLAFQTLDGETQNALFRLTGVYQSINQKLDESTVYVRQDWLSQLLDPDHQGNYVHEIAFLLHDQEVANDTTFLKQLRFACAPSARRRRNHVVRHAGRNWRCSPVSSVFDEAS